MKKVLITGASGFIGSFLVERFLEDQQFEVYAGIRKTSSKKYLTDKRIQFLTFDLNHLPSCQKDLEDIGFDYVIHNAGITQTKGADAYELINAQRSADFYKMLADLELQATKFVYMSSMGAYGPADFQENGVVSNASIPHPVTDYGKSKLLGEQLIIQDGRIPYSIIRPSAVYGPRETNMFTFFKMIHKGIEAHVGRSDQKLTFIYVKDLAELVYRATLSSEANTAYFGASETHYTSEELADLTKKILNKKTLKVKLPIGMVQVIAGISELWSSITGHHPILNRDKINEIKSLSWVADIEPVGRELDFENRYSLEEGLKETLTWYLKEGWL